MKTSLTTIVAAATVAAYAQSPAPGIKDFAIGGDLAAEAGRAGLRCGPAPATKDSALTWCSPHFDSSKWSDSIKTIAGVPTLTVFFSGFDNKLGSINWSFSQQHFSIVRDAFREKYPDMRCENSEVQNRAGANFEQSVCTLKTQGATLTIRRRSSKVTEGEVSLVTDQHLQLWEEDYRKRTGAAKKDI